MMVSAFSFTALILAFWGIAFHPKKQPGNGVTMASKKAVDSAPKGFEYRPAQRGNPKAFTH